jgi:hypothetical protein
MSMSKFLENCQVNNTADAEMLHFMEMKFLPFAIIMQNQGFDRSTIAEGIKTCLQMWIDKNCVETGRKSLKLT